MIVRQQLKANNRCCLENPHPIKECLLQFPRWWQSSFCLNIFSGRNYHFTGLSFSAWSRFTCCQVHSPEGHTPCRSSRMCHGFPGRMVRSPGSLGPGLSQVANSPESISFFKKKKRLEKNACDRSATLCLLFPVLLLRSSVSIHPVK